MSTIRDTAIVCRSKNAGPFDVTIDIGFADRETFEKVKASGIICPALFAERYGVDPEDVIFAVYDAGLAFKATLPRQIPAGDLGDTDVYGCQQHAPLLNVELPI
ncbi:MAG: DUF4387 domain-containing protein [Alphaproteobacteria bacterium]|nr:DUF4387 domain-containing protein [Alphaproteobacteria bacterium]